jgi:hypothetical protein
MKTKYQRNCLIIGIIFLAIGFGAAWEMGKLIYDSYDYIPLTSPIELFGPKKPDIDWDYYDRFKFKSWNSTINC